MTVAWFGGESKVSMKDAAKALYPPKVSSWVDRRDRSRFSTLILEHGEKHVQDWAVIAYSSPSSSKNSTNLKSTRRSKDTTWDQGKTPRASRQSSSKSRKALDKESHPTAHMTKIEGRLYLCSRSLVFEPNDASRAIVRCPFSKMSGPPKEYPNDSSIQKTGSFEPTCVEMDSSRHFAMKANNAIGPFQNLGVATTFRFTFLHSKPSSLVELCHRVFPIFMSKQTKELDVLLQPMHNRPFDPSNFLDGREVPLTAHLRCNLLQPLQCQPGCVVLTEERFYFQPAAGVLNSSMAQSWLQSHLVATARRYDGLKDAAIELYWKDGSSLLLAFERKHEREQVMRLLPTHIPCHTDRDFLLRASQAWQKGTITNFEYLLLINSAAGRSFQDLSRYPVFPWVIADYESPKLDLTKESTFRDLTKPVGALNANRLDYFRQRYESMQDMEEPFFYGTHYSAAGYVLYYLVRSMPEQMLCLQNGKFDAPDRMFHSVAHCFSCALSNHADVKELIPEFYNPNLDFDFLINARGLQLGATQSGDHVNDVTLPPWAKSPRDFLKKNGLALESEIATSMLPRWIDLIFGCKSRGDAAREACNLFQRFAYLGPADLSNIATQEERFQAELQATEFGIVPDLLFIGPHPRRHETVDESFINPDYGRTLVGSDEGKADAWELLEPPSVTSQENLENANDLLDPVSNNPASDAPTFATVDEPPPSPQIHQGNPFEMQRSSRDRLSIPLSGTGDSTDRKPNSSGSAFGQDTTTSSISTMGDALTNSPRPNRFPSAAGEASAEWDIKFIEKSRLHDDTVSGCSLINPGAPGNRSVLATTSLDGGLKMHTINSGTQDGDDSKRSQGLTGTLKRFSYITGTRSQSSSTTQSKLLEYRTHTSRDPLACLASAYDGHGGQIAFAGGHDDVVLAYGINSGCAVASVYSHRDAVTGLDILSRPPLLRSNSLWLEKATHVMVSSSWDATVKVWSLTVSGGETVSINREPLAELFDADSSVVCVSAAHSPDMRGIILAGGCADGSFIVWNLHSDGVKVVIHKEPARRGSGPCSTVKWSSQGDVLHLFTGFATGKVASFVLANGSLRKASAASLGIAIQCLVYSNHILLIGCADGGLRLIPIGDGACFTSDLSLWPAVNNKSSPGISSITMSPVGIPGDASFKFMCCTGAEDGSIALFELKRALR